MVNITWPKGYPFTPPVVDLEEFCNHHIPQSLKESIIEELKQLAQESSGEPLTFTLIEYLRDNFESYAKQIRDAKKRNANPASPQTEMEETTVGR